MEKSIMIATNPQVYLIINHHQINSLGEDTRRGHLKEIIRVII